jgi:hypothetical protein
MTAWKAGENDHVKVGNQVRPAAVKDALQDITQERPGEWGEDNGPRCSPPARQDEESSKQKDDQNQNGHTAQCAEVPRSFANPLRANYSPRGIRLAEPQKHSLIEYLCLTLTHLVGNRGEG